MVSVIHTNVDIVELVTAVLRKALIMSLKMVHLCKEHLSLVYEWQSLTCKLVRYLVAFEQDREGILPVATLTIICFTLN